MSNPTSKQRAHLRSLAHSLKPILQVGAEGVSEAFLESLDEAFNTRELLKVRVLETNDLDTREAAEAIRDGLEGVAVVQTIGRTVVLYRPDPDDPEIELPA
jgi:RNA-binding protein